MAERVTLNHQVVGSNPTGVITYLIDTKPIPVLGYKRSKRHSDFRGSADYGYCVSRKLHYLAINW